MHPSLAQSVGSKTERRPAIDLVLGGESTDAPDDRASEGNSHAAGSGTKSQMVTSGLSTLTGQADRSACQRDETGLMERPAASAKLLLLDAIRQSSAPNVQALHEVADLPAEPCRGVAETTSSSG